MRVRLSADEAQVLRSCVEESVAMRDLDDSSPFVAEGQLPPGAPPPPEELRQIRELVERVGVAGVDQLAPTGVVIKWRGALTDALKVRLVPEGDREIAERTLRKLRHRKYSGGAISTIAKEATRGLSVGPRRDSIFAGLGIRPPDDLENDRLLIEQRLANINGTAGCDEFIDLVSDVGSVSNMLMTDAAYDVEDRDPLR